MYYCLYQINNGNSNFSDTVSQSVWNDLPPDLKKKIDIDSNDQIRSHGYGDFGMY